MMFELASSIDPGTRVTEMLTLVRLDGEIISTFQSTVTSPLFVIDSIFADGRTKSACFLTLFKCDLHPSENEI